MTFDSYCKLGALLLGRHVFHCADRWGQVCRGFMAERRGRKWKGQVGLSRWSQALWMNRDGLYLHCWELRFHCFYGSKDVNLKLHTKFRPCCSLSHWVMHVYCFHPCILQQQNGRALWWCVPHTNVRELTAIWNCKFKFSLNCFLWHFPRWTDTVVNLSAKSYNGY